MEKPTYSLADELISAKEARIKSDSIQSGLLLKTTMLNKKIKDVVAAGGVVFTIQDPPEEILLLLADKGYVLEEVEGFSVPMWKVSF